MTNNSKKKIILVLLLVIVPGITHAGALTKPANNLGLVGYWSLNEGAGTQAGDFSGSGNDGTLTNMDPATDWVDGRHGKALDFDGGNDYVDINSDLGNPSGMTLSLWFKTPNTDSGTQYLLDGRNGGNWWFIQDYNDCGGRTADAGNICFENRVAVAPSDITGGKWYHVVLTENSSETKIYLNGDLKDTGSGEDPDIGSDMHIGARYTVSGHFDGKIDEVRTYNRVLGQTEAQNLYQQGLVTIKAPDKSSKVAHWKFDRASNSSFGETSSNPAHSCMDIHTTRPAATSGDYWINPSDPFQVTCEMSGNGGGWMKVSLARTNSHWAVGNDSDRCSTAGDTAKYYDHLTTSDYNFKHDTDDHNIYDYDVDYTSAGSTLTESQEDYIRDIVDEVATNTRPVGVSCDDDSSGIEHNTYIYNSTGDQFEPQDGYVDPSNEIGWWLWSHDTTNTFSTSSASISGSSYDHMPSSYLMPEKVGLQTDANGYAVFAYEKSYALLRESGGVKDYSNSGNGGVIYGNPQWADGKRENALDFDGSGDYVTISHDGQFFGSMSQFTVSFWGKWDSLNNWSRILDFGSSGGSNGAVLIANNSTSDDFTFEIRNSSGSSLGKCTASNAINTGEWAYWTVIWTDGQQKIYKNGSMIHSCSYTGTWSGISEPNKFLGKSNWSDDDFNGLIDDLRIYNQALSESRIKEIYQNNRHVFNASQNNKLANGLVGMWSFDGPDLDSTTAYDVSGNNNDGTLNGPTPAIGKVGQGLEFDGVNDYVALNNSYTYFPNGITVASWIKTEASIGIVASYDRSEIFRFGIGSSGTAGKVTWNTDDGSGTDDMSGNISVDDGEWHYIAATYDPSTATKKIFVDGLVDEEKSWGGASLGDGTTRYGFLGTGSEASSVDGSRGPDDWWNGKMDDVRIYDRALSADEVQRLYRMGH